MNKSDFSSHCSDISKEVTWRDFLGKKILQIWMRVDEDEYRIESPLTHLTCKISEEEYREIERANQTFREFWEEKVATTDYPNIEVVK